MATFFLSEKALKSIYWNHDSELYTILGEQDEVYLDLSQDDINKLKTSPDDDERTTDNPFTLFYDNSVNIKSGKEILNNLYNINIPNKKILSFGSPIIISSINDVKANDLMRDYGIICIPDVNVPSKLLDGENSKYLKSNIDDKNKSKVKNKKDHKDVTSWKDFIGELSQTPCNCIIINDHYLLQDAGSIDNPTLNEIELYNFLELMDCLLPKNAKNDVIQVLILHDADKDRDGFFANLSKEISSKINELRSSYTITVEFVAGKKGTSLFAYTHNRIIITNYLIVSAEHKFAAFTKDGKIIADQKITIDQLYANGITNNSDTPEKGKIIFSERVRDIVLYGIDHPYIKNPTLNDVKSTYRFSQDGKSNPNKVKMSEIKNRIIREML